MDGPTPTILQRFFAGPWPGRIWLGGWSIGLPVALLCSADIRWSRVRWSQIDVWPDIAYFILVSLILAVVGFLCGLVAGSFVFPIILYVRTRMNGGPFNPGDRVYIIHGPHAGTISTVTDQWEHGRLRVDLGPQALKDYTDGFYSYEVLRVRTPPPIPPMNS